MWKYAGELKQMKIQTKQTITMSSELFSDMQIV